MRIELTWPAWKAGVLPLNYTRILWGEKDSNLRRRTPADLQSAAIDRSAISPKDDESRFEEPDPSTVGHG